ncbi:MAG: hypothetical protein Q9207_002440 [Kuettlingeria erythrocarpa]
MKEARLLHFYTNLPKGGMWRLSSPASKGMPIEIDFQPKGVDTFAGKMTYHSGILEAITEVVGEGGCMYGWQVYSIGTKYEMVSGVMNAIVIVVREKGEGNDFRRKIAAAGGYIDTPGSSVTMGQQGGSEDVDYCSVASLEQG